METCADGSNLRITADSSSAFGPTWSADGASIFYAIDHAGSGSNIFRVDLVNGNRRLVTTGPTIDTRAAVSPDGSKLIFQSNRNGNCELYVMNHH